MGRWAGALIGWLVGLLVGRRCAGWLVEYMLQSRGIPRQIRGISPSTMHCSDRYRKPSRAMVASSCPPARPPTHPPTRPPERALVVCPAQIERGTLRETVR